jgi:hypothetical protein
MANSASHAALPYPVKGCRYTLAVPYLDADGDPTDPTTPDTEVSKDGGTFADCAEEVTTITGSNGAGFLTLTGAETDCSLLVLAAKVASGPKATLATLVPRVLPTIASGTAQAGANGTITLASGASAVDDYFVGCIVKTTGGTGGGGTGGANNQARVITDYVGSTKVATVVPNWETNPANDTTYEILLTETAYLLLANAVQIGGTTQTGRDLGASVLLSSGTGTGQISLSSGAVLLQATQTGVTIPTVTAVTNAVTVTGTPSVNVAQISGDATAADTLESLLDGGGGTLTANITGSITGNLSGSVGSVTGAVGSVTGAVGSVTGNVGGSVASVATGGITSASFAAGAINAAAIATGAIDADAVAADAGAEIATAVWALATRTLTANTNLNDPTAAAIADAVWDEVLSGHLTSGTTGAALNGAGSAGDPWTTALPGAYGAGTAGKILGDNLNATVGSRSSHSAADVWAVATRVLTAGTNLGTVSANVVQVNGESITTYTSATLAAAVRDVSNASPAANSLGAAVNSRASQTSVDTVDDFLDTEIAAIKAKTDNLPASPSSLDAAGVRSAVGLASANLDTQLADVPTVAEMTARTLATADYATAAALATVDTVVDSILDDTGTAGVVVAAGSKTGYALGATGVDSVVVESGLNARQALSVVASAVGGVLSGAGTGTEIIKGAGVATTRITATVDESGNRSAVTLSPPS